MVEKRMFEVIESYEDYLEERNGLMNLLNPDNFRRL